MSFGNIVFLPPMLQGLFKVECISIQHPLFGALCGYFAIKVLFLNVHFAYFSITFRCLQKCQVLMQSDSPHDVITYVVSLSLAVSNFGSRISGNFMIFFCFILILFCFACYIVYPSAIWLTKTFKFNDMKLNLL